MRRFLRYGAVLFLIPWGCARGAGAEPPGVGAPSQTTSAEESAESSQQGQGGNAPTSSARPGTESQPATESQPVARAEMPRPCEAGGETCFPPPGFVNALCQKKYSGVALTMFHRSTPWQRGYIKVKEVAPMNSHGGPSSVTRLGFLEEVILLQHRPNKHKQMMADMPETYDVIRFDGTCATLAEDEFMRKRPPLPPRHAPLLWSQLDSALRRTLADEPEVEKARLEQTESCRGSVVLGANSGCQKATEQLAEAILRAVSKQAELPLPVELPVWSVHSGG